MALSRRAFLRGREVAIRPPWAIEEEQFVKTCSHCGDCVRLCPTQILERGQGSFPKINFEEGECTFCGECAKNCRTKALRYSEEKPVWNLKAFISTTCLSMQGTTCRSCAEQCGEQAIHFLLQTGGISIPEVDFQHCTGCGACFRVCPAQSIQIKTQTTC